MLFVNSRGIRPALKRRWSGSVIVLNVPAFSCFSLKAIVSLYNIETRYLTVKELFQHAFILSRKSHRTNRFNMSYQYKRKSSNDNKTERSGDESIDGVDTRRINLSLDEKVSTAITLPPSFSRSKKLGSIIREGAVLLNHGAATIQKNIETTKSILTPVGGDETEPTARQLAEEHRIFTTAQTCLEELCMKDENFPLMAGDEPILLLGVRVNKAFTHADLLWSLPEVVLTAEELSDKQREFLKEKMSERLHGPPGKMLLQRVNALLSHYYPPKIRFKAAPQILVDHIIDDIEAE